MFVRQKKSPNSPKIAVQIVENMRDEGKMKQKIIRHIGMAKDEKHLEALVTLGEHIKAQIEAQKTLTLLQSEEIEAINMQSKKIKLQKKERIQKLETINQEKKVQNIKVTITNLQEKQRTTFGIHEIYGKVYDEIGFNKVLKNPARNVASLKMLKNIVLTRIALPTSKRKSQNILKNDFGIYHNLNQIYKMMDKIDDEVIQKIQNIAYSHTKSLLREQIDVIFFDATTLYFESFTEDELRQCGFSKDHKFQETQVLLILLVTKQGLPIGYKVFPGATYEGHTVIPILKEIREEYDLDKVIFIADSGLFNQENLSALEANKFQYIIGARIKNLNQEIKKEILDQTNYRKINNHDQNKNNNISNNEYTSVKKIILSKQKRFLIASYNTIRARKDQHEREKNLQKLLQKTQKSNNPKDFISNFGYKKYLQLNTKDKIILNQETIQEDQKWDGLSGIITNIENFTEENLLSYYHDLWQIEESFRISKNDLRIRPIFHWKPERIKAHIAMVFMAFTCVRNLEYRLRLQYKKMSPEVIRNELMHIQGSLIIDQETNKRYMLPSCYTENAKKIYKIMNMPIKKNCFPLDE